MSNRYWKKHVLQTGQGRYIVKSKIMTLCLKCYNGKLHEIFNFDHTNAEELKLNTICDSTPINHGSVQYNEMERVKV